MVDRLGERDGLLPDEKRYSVVKVDTWKAPDDDDFAFKVGEIDSLADGPVTAAGRGESVVVLDADGKRVSATDGPDHPTASTTRDEED
jgi:hypothetical protein